MQHLYLVKRLLSLKYHQLLVLQRYIEVAVMYSSGEYLGLEVYLLELLVNLLVLVAESEHLIEAALNQYALPRHHYTRRDLETLWLLKLVLVNAETSLLKPFLEVES
jgi:hypothetical protein